MASAYQADRDRLAGVAEDDQRKFGLAGQRWCLVGERLLRRQDRGKSAGRRAGADHGNRYRCCVHDLEHSAAEPDIVRGAADSHDAARDEGTQHRSN